MVPDPIVSAWSHIFAPDCSIRSIMFPDCSKLLQMVPNCSRLLQIHREDVAGCARYADQPEINTGGIREEDNRRVQTEEIECDEGKIRSTKEV